MDKKSTPSNHTTAMPDRTVDKNIDTEAPRRSTLEFLRLYARCYHYEPRLSAPLGNMIIN